MGGEIIAEKFALVKTRGSNGVAFTHIVEDTLLGERAVVKVSDAFGSLAFDYLKTINLAREMDIPGVLMPFEGGILEEESGFYFAFPEVGEPSLDNYLRIGVPLTCEEALGIILQLLSILEDLHGAGFVHLFIGTRNIFYRPRGQVTLKDPALKVEFFHPFLESIDAPDFSYFSPEVMDGGEPGPQADLYALGRLAERLSEECVDAGTSPASEILRWLEERLRSGLAGSDASPADIRREVEDMLSGRVDGLGATASLDAVEYRAGDSGRMSPQGKRKSSRARRGGGNGKRTGMHVAIICVIALALMASLAFATGIGGQDGRPPEAGMAGGSSAGAGKVVAAKAQVKGEPEEATAPAVADGAEGEPEESGDQAASPASAGGEVSTGEAADGDSAETSPPPDSGSGQPAPPPEGSPAGPVATFTVSPGQGQSPLQVYLDASASYDPDGSIVSYSWSFGGSGKSVYHVFESNVIPATLPVTLTVTDDGGHSASATRYVTLY